MVDIFNLTVADCAVIIGNSHLHLLVRIDTRACSGLYVITTTHPTPVWPSTRYTVEVTATESALSFPVMTDWSYMHTIM